MLKRTEEDVVSKRPFQVTLGDTEFQIKPLPITQQRLWREGLIKRLDPVIAKFSGRDMAEALSGGLAAALLQFPEEIEALVFEYAPELLGSKEAILSSATEEQFAAAFSAIMVVAYPFLPQLTTVTQLRLTSK